MTTYTQTKQIPRPPVVAILGHIDHGKSTLLDFIRKSNIVSGEAGGITQHLGAYEAEIKDSDGNQRRITFLDTPGHEAFSAVRTRGASVADVAILIVAADDGVKTQTKEALGAIRDSETPFVVAINKIDKENSNIEKVVSDLTENEVYLEGRGGDISYAEISAKSGKGVDNLLELVLLTSDVADLRGDPSVPAEGFVVESHVDKQKGLTGTLLIKNGSLKKGMCVASGKAMAPVRILETVTGEPLEEASFSSPIHIMGWNSLPTVGMSFSSFESKRDAEGFCASQESTPQQIEKMGEQSNNDESEEKKVIPIVIKTDTAGGVDAARHEVQKIVAGMPDTTEVKIVKADVGTITENDVKAVGGDENALIVGFHTKVDSGVKELAEKDGIALETFDIIYEMSEWLTNEIQKRTPKEKIEEVRGRAKLLKMFSQTGNKYLVGGRVGEGAIQVGNTLRIMRRDNLVGEGTVLELQKQRAEVKSVSLDDEFGMKIQSKTLPAAGDVLESVAIVER